MKPLSQEEEAQGAAKHIMKEKGQQLQEEVKFERELGMQGSDYQENEKGHQKASNGNIQKAPSETPKKIEKSSFDHFFEKGMLEELANNESIDVPQPWLLKGKKKAISREKDLYKVEIGESVNTIYTKDVVLLVVGATGSGKTTLINFMVNHLFGIKFEDSYRFKLIHESDNPNQAHSQTQQVTAYRLNHHDIMKFPHTLTIIDTVFVLFNAQVLLNAHRLISEVSTDIFF